jgi:hypothetical protein
VIHAGNHPSFKQAGDRIDKFGETHHDQYFETLSSNILNIIDYAHPDIAIALENHAWNHLTREVARKLIPDGLKLCLDIAKLYDSNQALIENDWMIFNKNCGSIEVVHVHDWVNGLQSHQIIGTGSIDFEQSLRLLSGLEAPAQYVFEVRPRTAAHESLHRFAGLLKDLNINLI